LWAEEKESNGDPIKIKRGTASGPCPFNFSSTDEPASIAVEPKRPQKI
jgi:hypothetical protein